MGLDMYLMRRKYVKNWEHTPKERQFKVHGKAMIGQEIINLSDLSYLEFEAIYWRKANAIHKWFVDNVQKGEDDCRSYGVDVDDLENLLLTVDVCLANKKECHKLLPLLDGPFFGSREYDEYYFEELERTRDEINILLRNYPDDEYTYESSW